MSAVSPYHKELEKVIAEEGYSRDQIYNADEMGLRWRLTPSFSLNSSGAIREINFKKAKNRVTLLGCVNTSGSHCLLLAFVNVSAKPRCFKRIDTSSLLVHYFLQKKLWMDCNIFSEWFQQQFLPSVRMFCSNNGLEKKALLLFDNAASHLSSAMLQLDNSKIKAMFLPPNNIQPTDQAVIVPCKCQYKKKFLAHIILENDSADKSVPEILKTITMKDIMSS